MNLGNREERRSNQIVLGEKFLSSRPFCLFSFRCDSVKLCKTVLYSSVINLYFLNVVTVSRCFYGSHEDSDFDGNIYILKV
jgi:hypothetical protein